MVDIFDEVAEDLRAERTKALLMRYGGVLVAAAILVVVGVGGWKGWQWYQARHAAQAATSFLQAMNMADTVGPGHHLSAKDRASALAAFGKAGEIDGEGYRTLSRLRQAALQAQAGNLAAADKLWDQVAGDGSADRLLRGLASLLWVQHQLDAGDPATIEARLKPLTVPGNVWRPLALEQQALLDLRTGAKDKARATLKQLSTDVTTPPGVRGRAGLLLAELGQ